MVFNNMQTYSTLCDKEKNRHSDQLQYSQHKLRGITGFIENWFIKDTANMLRTLEQDTGWFSLNTFCGINNHI